MTDDQHHHDLRRVFVYGTLKPGEANAGVAHQAGTFKVQQAWIQGFTLFDLIPEGYPAVVASSNPKAVVHGYILDYDPAWALSVLDDLEGLYDVPPLYWRTVVITQPDQLRAHLYLYCNEARLTRAGATPVPSGIWQASIAPTRNLDNLR